MGTPSAGALADQIRGALDPPDAYFDAEVHGATKAAVLVPLYVEDGELHAVFTKRRDDLRRHPGEISFPGGRRDDHDADLIQTAEREAEEEIGLPPDAVEILGSLPPTPTIATGYAVYPFVGLLEPGHEWTPSAEEVAVVLELTLSDLKAGFARRLIVRRGFPFWTNTYEVGDSLIWGATARILGDLIERIDPLL
jgi:8-oxo-dGTP pyrophosphatase MutT (NUDIX family)